MRRFSFRFLKLLALSCGSLFAGLTAEGQTLDRLPPVNSDNQVVHASTEEATADYGSPSLEELLRRLRETEARLAAIEEERSSGAAPSDGEPTHMVNTERLDSMNTMDSMNTTELMQDPPKPKKWYEKYTIRGYAQFRFNDILYEAPGSAPAIHNGDSSVGENQTFIIRRARVIIQGDASEHVSIYLQPDFASTPNGAVDGIQFTQIRDWYADVHLDKERVHRIRVGQSKIPFGWENLQSSSNRLPLDRSDSLNSAAKNERDLGLFYYWTPEFAQDTFKYIMDEGLKGSGNYGLWGVGVYAGQGGSLREQNDSLHVISRLTLPITLENGQIFEAGIQGYTGMYTVLSSAISPLGVGPAVRPLGTLETGDVDGIIDKRVGATFVYYPQPLGFQAEWNVGRGPGLNDAQTAVVDRPLYGGYVQSMYRYQTDCYGELWPFIRWNYYKGGYKSERNAPFVEIDELEVGVEWQMGKHFELVGMYTLTDRTNTRAISSANTLSYEQFDGSLLRFQLQFNY